MDGQTLNNEHIGINWNTNEFLTNMIIITRLTKVHILYNSFIPFGVIFKHYIFHTCWALMINVPLKRSFSFKFHSNAICCITPWCSTKGSFLHQRHHVLRFVLKFKNSVKALGRKTEHVWCWQRLQIQHCTYWQSYTALRL